VINGLQPYPIYKDTGVPWLGELPDSWQLLRGKNVFLVIDVRSETGSEELLTVSSADGVVPRSQKTVTMFKAESYVGHKLCWPGDLVINSLWAWMQGLGFANHHGLVSSAYGVYRPRPSFVEYPRYFNYLLRSAAYRWELQTRSKGVWLSRLQLSDHAFLDLPIVVPPAADQHAIVRFLNHVDRRVARYIQGKRRLAALLEEEKHATVYLAVTRGLDTNVRLKPSGVEWLGDVPEHWAVRKLRHCGMIVGGMTPSMDVPEYWDGNIPWVSPKDMKRLAISDSTMHVSQLAIQKTGLREIPASAVLLVVRGMILARRIPVAWTTSPVTINQDMKALLPRAEIDARFLALSLGSAGQALMALVDEAGHGTRRLPTERWRETSIAIPSLPEQKGILQALEDVTNDLDAAIELARNEMTLVREYRTRLITDVVTGKLDVREAAAKLPAESDEPPALDEAEALNGDEADNDALEDVEVEAGV
jgi:type I restriction enzyme S subunit